MQEQEDLKILENSINDLIQKIKSLGIKGKSDSLKLELKKIFLSN